MLFKNIMTNVEKNNYDINYKTFFKIKLDITFIYIITI